MHRKYLLLGILYFFFTLSTSQAHLGYEEEFEVFIKAENPWVTTWQARTISRHIILNSVEKGFDPVLVLGIMQNESDYDYKTCSRNKITKRRIACGLMQIHIRTWLWEHHEDNLKIANIAHSVRDLYNIPINIRAGLHILDVTRDDCITWSQMTEWKGKKGNKENRMLSKGYKDVLHCTVARYNGEPGRKKHIYYKKVMDKIDEFYGINSITKESREKLVDTRIVLASNDKLYR